MIQKISTFFLQFCAVLCVILFSLTFAMALTLVNAESQLFKAETYKNALHASQVYARLPSLLSEQLLTGELSITDQPGDKSGFLNYLNEKDWEILISTVFPPDEMRSFSEQTLDQVFNSLNSKTPTAQADAFTISLIPIKQSIRENGAQAIRKMLLDHPNCSIPELTTLVSEFAFDLPRAQGQLCNPPPEISLLISSAIDQAIQIQSAALPDSLPILGTEQSLEVLPNIDQARLIMRFGLLIPLVFLLLIGLLAARSRKSQLRWLGGSLIIGGMLSLLIGIAGIPVTRFMWSVVPPSRLSAALLDVLWAVLQAVTFPVIIQSVIAVALGMVMYLIGRKRRPAIIVKDKPDN